MKTFKEMRRTGEVKRGEANSVRLGDLHEEPGFNLRDYADPEFQNGISELAEYIAAGGPIPPLEVRPREDGGAWLVDGHRRRLALRQLLLEERLPLDNNGDYWVRVEPFTGNDVQRTLRIMSSQEGQKLSALEIAKGYERLRALGLSVADIAKARHKSLSHVEQSLLLLNHGNSDVHQLVASGAVSPTLATELVREHGEKAGEVIKAAAAKTGGKVTARTVKGPSVPRKLLDRLHVSAGALWDSLGESARLATEEDDGHEPVGTVLVDAAKLANLMAVVREARAALEAK